MTLEYCLKDIGKVVTGKTPKTAIAENFGVDYPFITPRDMNGDKFCCFRF
jgi:type I restriction enzyme S subunit